MLKTLLSTAAFAVSGFLLLPARAAVSQCTFASHYGVGDGYHGKSTANGEKFNAYGKTAAHRTLPFGTRLLVQNPANNKTVVVRINDRGPFHAGRDIDLSYGAFGELAGTGTGVTKVCYSRIA